MNGQKADTISIISPANKSHCCQTNLPRSYRRSIPFVAFICRAPIRARIFDVHRKKKKKKEKTCSRSIIDLILTTKQRSLNSSSARALDIFQLWTEIETEEREWECIKFLRLRILLNWISIQNSKSKYKTYNRIFKNKFPRSIYIYICICMNAASKGNFKGKKILRISLLLPTSWSQASSATVTYHPSHIAFLSVHFSFGKRENIPWRRRNLRRESLSIGESREIGDPAQNQSGNWFATIVEGAGLFTRLPDPSCAPSLPPFPLSFLSSFFGRFSPPSTTSSSSSSCRDKFPREDAPLCADSRCPARLSEDWNRVKNCQSTGRRFEDRIWLSNFDNCYSWKDKKKRKKKL